MVHGAAVSCFKTEAVFLTRDSKPATGNFSATMSGGIGLLACRLMALAVFGIGALAGVPADAASISLPDIVKRMYVDSEFAAKTPAGSGKKRFSTEGDTELAFDYKKVTFNMDVNLTIPANTGQLEQAYISMPLVQGLSLTGGVMNNPLGWEQEDAPDRDQISHGQLWTLLDGQTSLSGNNVEGLAFRGTLGHSALFAGLLNDLGNVANKRSVEVVFTSHPVDKLDLTAGFVTQSRLDANPRSAESLLDLNAQWHGGAYSAAFEYFAGDKLINAGYGLYGRYRWRSLLVSARVDQVRYLITGIKNTTTYTVTAAYLFGDSFKLALEYKNSRNSNTLPVVLTLPDNGNSILLQALAVL